MFTSISYVNAITGDRITIRKVHLKVLRRHVRTEPLISKKTGKQIGWHTKPADWYLAWSSRTRYGTRYHYDGLENERGFKTKREAEAKRREILARKIQAL